MEKPILVIGHRHPDTDSVCSALAYAYLKREMGTNAVAGRAGKLNNETKFVLDYFGVEAPLLINDIYPQLNDITLKQPPVLQLSSTLADVGHLFKQAPLTKALPVLDAEQRVVGIVATADLAAMYYEDINNKQLRDSLTPVSEFMHTPVTTLGSTDLLSDVRTKMLEAQFVNYPVTEHGRYLGMIDRGMMLVPQRQRVILVDHNERGQAVEGIEDAEILEIIDHHRLGGLTTGNPIFIRQEPVGSTATIVANLAWHRKVELPREIAGLLFAAIISDTLYFHSPTCTSWDEDTVFKLKQEAEIEDVDKLALEILHHGADITGLSIQEILHQDVKEFTFGGSKVSISQFSIMNNRQALERTEEFIAGLNSMRTKDKCDLSLLMLTDVLAEVTYLFASEGYAGQLRAAFGPLAAQGYYHLPQVLSRKKQVVPPLAEALR